MAKKKQTVTNAMRMLDKSKVDYRVIEYDAGGEIGENFGERIAALCGIPPEKSFKTLVARGKSECYTAVIPVNEELDLKKLAQLSGEKKVELVHVKEILALTGYIRGGVSPIGMKKKFKTFINDSITALDEAAVSGGVCGVTLFMKPESLIAVTDATTADIIKRGDE